jgi:hypothetical protein
MEPTKEGEATMSMTDREADLARFANWPKHGVPTISIEGEPFEIQHVDLRELERLPGGRGIDLALLRRLESLGWVIVDEFRQTAFLTEVGVGMWYQAYDQLFEMRRPRGGNGVGTAFDNPKLIAAINKRNADDADRISFPGGNRARRRWR